VPDARGYGRIDVTKANPDPVADAALAAKPAASQNPEKWILDHPGSVQQHIGEKIQGDWDVELEGRAPTFWTEHGDQVYRRALRPFVVL
jgi:hypothetical protein